LEVKKFKKYVLTGGPCTGKTTILRGLEQRIYTVIPEVAREVIAEEKAKEKENPGYRGIFPHVNLYEFEKRIIDKQFEYEQKIIDEIVFLDRSLVDAVAYAELNGKNLGNDVYQRIRHAGYTKIFYLDQLPFYMQDRERKEHPRLARRIHEQIYKTYRQTGFDIVIVPPISIERRIEFILKNLKG